MSCIEVFPSPRAFFRFHVTIAFGGVVVAVNQKSRFLFSSSLSCLGSWPMGLLIINFWTFRSNRFWNLSGRPQDSKTTGRFGMIGCQRRHESVGSIEAFVGSVLMDSKLDSIFLDR